MKVINGDILSPTDDVDAICIPTNLQRRMDGTAVMGAGLALAAHKKWYLAYAYGQRLFSGAKSVVVIKTIGEDEIIHIVSVPTKVHWRDNSTVELITKSLNDLVDIADSLSLKQVWVPSLGTGLGGLSTNIVWPLMHEKLDDRFTMVLKK